MNAVPVHFTVVINFILAFIPFALAFYLFKCSHHRSVLWWLLTLMYVLFLPNSAYVLTDVIHFIAALKSPNPSTAYILLVLLPFYTLFILINFEFYVISIQWADKYLGRFQRLESSDIIHHPMTVFRDVLVDISDGSSLLIIVGLFVVFYSLYTVISRVNNTIKAKVKSYIAKRSMQILASE